MTAMEPFDESVQEIVARETARRKRVLLAFLALLLVPIAIGAYALSRAKKETEAIVDAVTTPVTERVNRKTAADFRKAKYDERDDEGAGDEGDETVSAD